VDLRGVEENITGAVLMARALMCDEAIIDRDWTPESVKQMADGYGLFAFIMRFPVRPEVWVYKETDGVFPVGEEIAKITSPDWRAEP
jgi:hypothetical protein